ncbi:MAG: glycosyltransferase [Bacteroidia bacterium]|nr:glycosyltransferase [Bacteroidia bacterium]
MYYLSILLFIIYGLGLCSLWLYSLGTFTLAIRFFSERKYFKKKDEEWLVSDYELLAVTIQLPLYNEKYVVDRLLESIAAQDYPPHLITVQILDDSTDETTAIIQAKLPSLAGSGIRFELIRREKRQGFKAGALADAFTMIKGDYVAIFDADFVPRPDFLRKMMGYLIHHPSIGLVQTRWEYLNQSDSLLTQLQAFHLDAHFAVEQFVRSQSGWFMNFNGTAGIWRKQCIADGGGWQSDTLTEDLDLSYRSQLSGWKMDYIDNVGSPSELPVLMSAVKSQQYRWMKGGAEVGRKLLLTVWKADIPFSTKIQATHHLLGSSVFILSLLTGIFTLPVFITQSYLPQGIYPVFDISKYLFSNFFFFFFFYFTANLARTGNPGKALLRTLIYIFPFLTFMMGLSLHNAIAAFQGLTGKKTPFVRTPKFRVSNKWKENSYRERKIPVITFMEAMIGIYFAISSIYLIMHQNYTLLPFQAMLMTGYFAVVYLTIKHTN